MLEHLVLTLGRAARAFSAMAAAALLGALLAIPAAVAQTETSESEEAPVAILVVSMDRILRDSQAGQSIREQAEELSTALRTELDLRREALREEERDLASLRDGLERATFNQRAEEFEEKVRALRRDEQDDGARLQRALARATSELRRSLQPILVTIMSERRAGVMLDEQHVLFNDKSLDVTEEAIKRLDVAAPKIDFTLSATESE